MSQSERWDLGDEKDLDRLLKESKQFKGESLWNDAWRRLRRNRTAFWALLFLAFFGVVSFLAPAFPLPSPKALDTSKGIAQPPSWPWSAPTVASEWNPEEREDDDDIAPGILPSRTVAGLWNDGWRHQSIVAFQVPSADYDPQPLVDHVTEISGRVPRLGTVRPAEEGFVRYLSVLLDSDDPTRTDEVSTDVTGELIVWRFKVNPDDEDDTEHGVVYDLNLEREVGPLKSWTVDNRSPRIQLRLYPEDCETPHTGYVYTATLPSFLRGMGSRLILNGTVYDNEGAAPVPDTYTKVDGCTAEADEAKLIEHEDLGRRFAQSETTLPGGATYLTTTYENGYWELGFIDRSLVALRAKVFGGWQTGNWLGTDEKGRDLLSRIIWGSRTSILVALAAAACSLLIGVVYGAFSGLMGGRIDNLMMRIVDILYSVPFIFVVIFLITIINDPERRQMLEDIYGIDRETVFFVVIGAIYWLTMARVVRGQVLSLKNSEFIEAARVMGASTSRILFSHIVPNVLSIVIVYLTLTIPAVMLFEAFLSFLGLGIEPPKVSWGLLANDGTKAINPIKIYWWLVLFPAAAMGATLLALNILGDGLRDALDPKMRGKD